MSRPVPRVPPQFSELLLATRTGGAANDDYQSSGTAAVRIPRDRYVRLTNWTSFVWDPSTSIPQTLSSPATVVVFRLFLERPGTTAHSPGGQTVIVASQTGGADSGMLDITLQPGDVLIASWRGVAAIGNTGYCRVNGTYILL